MSVISLDQASTIVDAALAKGRSLGLKPMTIAVLDPGGHAVVLKREDGSGILRVEIATGKAWGALALGTGSRALAERVAGGAAGAAFGNAIAAASGGRVVPVAGGVLVRDGRGAVIGAVGASGDLSDQDEICALAGIEAAGLVGDPGASA